MLKRVRESNGALQSAFVTSKARLATVPDVPTVEELGVKPEEGVYAVMATSRILVGPAGIDQGIAEMLVTATGKAEAGPEFAAAMKKGDLGNDGEIRGGQGAYQIGGGGIQCRQGYGQILRQIRA